VNIKLEHNFRTWCPDKRGLFVGMISKGAINPNMCDVAAYMKAVCKQSVMPENAQRWDPNKYVGDGFEVFVEALIKLMGLHPDIGVADYIPQPGNDNGVDGVGKGILDLRTITIQAKYRPREDALLSAGKDRLDSFFTESVGKNFRIKLDWDENDKLIGQKPMLVVTTAAGLNDYTRDEKFHGVVRCLNSKDLNRMVGGNTAFWKQFHDLMI